MTAWRCFAYFSDLVVLGPKCRTVECLAPARRRVWWPGREPILCCERCADGWRQIADRGFGMAIAVDELHYTTAEDPAVQRFRNLELE